MLPWISSILFFIFTTVLPFSTCAEEGLPIFYWQGESFVNFGDRLSLELVQRITGSKIRSYRKKLKQMDRKLLAIGSILHFACDKDIVWGSGVNGKQLDLRRYSFSSLDVRAVRGPLTRQFLFEHFHIDCPEVYGDPALLIPYFFPEFKKSKSPSNSYLIIPHYSEKHLFNEKDPHVIFPTRPWEEVIERILDSQFVISSSLHGIIVAEAFGIPARMLRISENEPLFKYKDYYAGTNRPFFQYANSVSEALQMGGEPPFFCDLKRLYEAFPFEFWPNTNFQCPVFQ
jgi:pyruvyltransferase